MINKILKILTNKKNQIEGQRISEKYFKKRNLCKELEFLKKHNINSTQTLYNYINDTNDICEYPGCKNKRRFTGFKNGYKKYCEHHGRTLNNNKSETCEHVIEPDVNFTKRKYLEETIKLLKVNNKYVSPRTKYPRINQYSENLYEDILDTTFYIDMSHKFSERLYHIENDLCEIPKCDSCGEPLDNFISSTIGYRSNHCKKNKCAINHANLSKTEVSENILRYHYNKHKKFYESQNSDEYIVEFFTFDEYIKNRDSTIVKYTHTKCCKSYERNLSYQGKFQCPYCFPIRSKQQFFIYDYIKSLGVNSSFNNRKLLRGKEIDILIESHNLGIEYNGQAFHSFGRSTDARFNNYDSEATQKYKDIEKLDMCEKKGVQLLVIFSSEWFHKTDIWKSVIKSKLGLLESLNIDKCYIKEIGAKEAREFCDKNHLQGYIESDTHLGLYNQNDLIQVMTFNQIQNNNFELTRMCSELFTHVDSSKLLNYFEINYNPKSIVVHANRRYSSGSEYEKLGFKFKYNTEPNYFYIQGFDYDKNMLESGVKYQKHKLKGALPKFFKNLTETENMYINTYRKIYDCGDKVYFKKYK